MREETIIDKLVRLARYDLKLVGKAINRSARGKTSADLSDVVRYILEHRNV